MRTVTHVIEFSLDGRTWMTWDFVPHSDMVTEDENALTAKERWRKRLPGESHRGMLIFRLVKRTAVITDKVLAEEPRKDVVIFRKWKAHPRSVIALFPCVDEGRGMVSSYEHMGQHGGADYNGVMSATRAATPDEYADLERELKSAPFHYRLDIRKRRP